MCHTGSRSSTAATKEPKPEIANEIILLLISSTYMGFVVSTFTESGTGCAAVIYLILKVVIQVLQLTYRKAVFSWNNSVPFLL